MDAGTPTPTPDPKNKKGDALTDGTYIRTFAKDVAHVTGKPIQAGKITVPKKDISLPKVPKTLEEELTPDPNSITIPISAETKKTALEIKSSVEDARSEILSRLKSQMPTIVDSVPKPQKLTPPPAPLPAPVPLQETPPQSFAPPPVPLSPKKKGPSISPLLMSFCMRRYSLSVVYP